MRISDWSSDVCSSDLLMLGDRSRGTIGGAEFDLMKPSAYLINTGRAEIVDQAALVDALTRGRIAGAALDVYDHEPLPADHPLRRLDRAPLMPHQGYVVEQNYRLFFQHADRKSTRLNSSHSFASRMPS